MKTHKISKSTKVFMGLLVLLVIASVAIGMSNIFAEPTIERLVSTKESYGTFKPSRLIDEDTKEEFKPIDFINVTQLAFTYTQWEEAKDKNGEVELNDIYNKENFAKDMMMGNSRYALLESKNQNDNFYITQFRDLEKYNAMLADFKMSDQDYNASMKPEESFFYDAKTNYLYISKSLIKDRLAQKKYDTLRSQVVLLVKDINKFTKKTNVFTVFSADVKDWHGIEKRGVNKEFEINMKDVDHSGFTFQLFESKDLPYISAENLRVSVDGGEYKRGEDWSYNPNNGEITIYIPPFLAQRIIVHVDNINKVDNQTISEIQAIQQDDVTPMAEERGIGDKFEGNAPFLKEITYTDREPKIGMSQPLNFTASAFSKNPSGWVHSSFKDPQNNGYNRYQGYNVTHVRADEGVSIPTSDVHEAVRSYVDSQLSSASYLAHITTPSILGKGSIAKENFGNIINNIHLQLAGKNANGIQDALANANATILSEKLTGAQGSTISNDYATRNWGIPGWDVVYMPGHSTRNLLGGKVTKGYPFFDTICCEISVPVGSSIAGPVQGDLSANATIVDKDEKYLYICVWSRTGRKAGVEADHGQWLLAFTRVPYIYNGKGKFEISKVDEKTGKLLAGAVYDITDANGRVLQTITTGTSPVQTKEFDKGTYYLIEKKAPKGYLLDKTRRSIKVEPGKTAAVKVSDKRQQVDFTLTVYDQTTEHQSAKVPLKGITFDLYNPQGQKVQSFTTNDKGQINGKVDALGIYKITQSNTIPNYRIESDINNKYHCHDIVINGTPTDTGVNITQNIIHYEQRQNVIIKSHVQDQNLLDGTPKELGGDINSNGLATLVDAHYTLKTKSEILLGYNNGSPIKIPAGQPLKIVTKDKNGRKITSSIAYSYPEGNRAYVYAEGIEYGGKEYPLPNGLYEWVLTTPSSGYYNTKKVTSVDGQWTQQNWKVPILNITSFPTIQERQEATIDLIVKSYVDDDRNQSKPQPNIYKNKVYTSLLPPPRENQGQVGWKKYVDDRFTKTISSNEKTISQTSKEEAILYEGQKAIATVHTYKLAPNAIYELVNIGDIVDIKTGQVIKTHTILGRYITDNQGHIKATKLGTNEFNNPNKESASMPKIAAAKPITVGGVLTTGALPNGTYALTPLITPDAHYPELGLSEDIVFDTGWNVNNTNSKVVAANSETLLRTKSTNPQVKVDIPIAPDPTPNPVDPYDPYHPDDPKNPDDSNDITKVTRDWVDENAKNFAYRVVDPDNITMTNGTINYDVEDVLPTTFSFYPKNDMKIEDIYKYKYSVSYYYEITKNEYDAAPQSLKANKEYIYSAKNGTYLRRFKTNSLSGGDYLQDVIVLNQTSPGYVSYEEASRNQTISGAIYNTQWLRDKLSQKSNGQYQVYVVLDISYSYDSKFSGENIVVHSANRVLKPLTIKNRNLVPLD